MSAHSIAAIARVALFAVALAVAAGTVRHSLRLARSRSPTERAEAFGGLWTGAVATMVFGPLMAVVLMD